METPLQEMVQSLKQYLALETASGMREPFSAARGDRPRSSSRLDGPLEALMQEVTACTRCGLHATRTNVVFGHGDPHAALMFIGEAPGHDEDLQALPFVGRAGQLLTKIIEAMGMKRSDVYIANILKCRPPHNRAPLPTEILACADNVRRQVAAIRPKVICTLGKFASQTLLKTETPISSLRGKFQDYEGIRVMPTFHPAYLLRNPDDKKLVWDDMKKILKVL